MICPDCRGRGYRFFENGMMAHEPCVSCEGKGTYPGGTFVYRDGELVPKHLAAPLIPRGAASKLSAPHVISDATDAFRSMADGHLYDSKSAYRAELKRQGFREIGNDVDGHLKDVEATNPQRPKAKADVIKAYQKVRDGYKPPPGPPLDPELD